MLILYKSLVQNHFEYCCPLWNPSSPSEINLLESVQQTFTSKIWALQHLDCLDRLTALELMSLQRQRERYIIFQMWKTLHSLNPNDLNILLSEISRLGVKAKIPCLSKSSSSCNQTLYDSSFAARGLRLWNTLPDHLQAIAVADKFKNKLTIPDKPWVCASRNSILPWFKNTAEAKLLGWSDNLMAL